MDPAQGDEVVLVLHVKQILLTQHLTRVRLPLLLGHNHMGDAQCVLRLDTNKQQQTTSTTTIYTQQYKNGPKLLI